MADIIQCLLAESKQAPYGIVEGLEKGIIWHICRTIC